MSILNVNCISSLPGYINNKSEIIYPCCKMTKLTAIALAIALVFLVAPAFSKRKNVSDWSNNNFIILERKM